MRECDLKFVMVSSAILKSSTYSEGSVKRRLTEIPSIEIPLSLFIFDVAYTLSSEGIADAKRLARYFYGIDKYELESLLDYDNLTYPILFQQVLSISKRAR